MNKKELITKKTNALVEAKTGNLRLFDDKMINILYYLIEKSEQSTIVINLLQIKKLLKINTNNYIELIIQSLERLDTKKISLRNINFKGKKIDWIRSSVIKEMIIYSESRSKLQIEISLPIIEGLKQKSNFTPLDITICNQFKTKYGLKLYELYKRYENFKTYHYSFIQNVENSFSISIDDAQERFGNSYVYPSQWKEVFSRGLKEIADIADINIKIIYIKQTKVFVFYWQRLDMTSDFKSFQKYIRQNYINKTIYKYTQKNGNIEVELSVNQNGKLYNLLSTKAIKAKNANELWKWLFENQSKWRKL